ncbi:GNAT family N-acetyltransferase [Paenibacillus qinlingensis]|uniref:RimJ/RimL family protein N-acetyltransferase n=1 Tax=Paenibacillus qinlingensis TaxID=1837343 RepID=A0ABU1P672_9BACL|nr:GNAT family N-acetyltransferase [Paenibacillus qinlingensis]MDR6555265.1 RimJ/RimL family protein N-acetyltransferase [Paenibacillus qinlingensis]
MYTCRPASTEDLHIISTFPRNAEELYFMSPAFQFPLTPEQLIASTQNRLKQTVVVDEKGQVLGYANIYGYEEGNRCWLGNVIVSSEARGKGAAESLIRTMMAQAKDELQVKELHLVCHNVNTRGLLFYAKLGFKPYQVEKKKNHVDQTIAGIMMKMVFSEG